MRNVIHVLQGVVAILTARVEETLIFSFPVKVIIFSYGKAFDPFRLEFF